MDWIPKEEVESDQMEAFIKKVEPGHVLAYCTGANQVPAIGFRQHPKIVFVHNKDKFIPAANTCDFKLTIFVNDVTVTQLFMTYMAKALMNGVVFSDL